MITSLRWIGLAALGFSLTGCVSSDQYSALKLERDRIAEQLISAQRDASSSKAAADQAQSQLTALGANGNTSTALVANLTTQNNDLQSQLADLNRRYAEAMAHQGTSGPLPPPLNDALTAFAQQNPDLVDFDSSRGIVKFKSDVLFGAGDATVNAKSKDVIDRFSKILTSGAASGYELLIAGHTDNQPVHSAAALAAGHKDNWFLSAHRAISVANELMKNGVSQNRVGVVGYADQHPIASNTSGAGQAQNRRVEVLILPTTVHGGPIASRKDNAKTAVGKQPAVVNKDGVPIAPKTPVFNK